MNELATYAAHVQARLTYAALAIFFAVIVGVGVLAVYAKDINTQLLTLLVTLATATVTLATGAFAFELSKSLIRPLRPPAHRPPRPLRH